MLLQRRGPDLQGKVEMVVNVSHSTSVKVSFEGSVLHLRGPKTQQPLVDECGNVLLWNGEIFSCDVEVSSAFHLHSSDQLYCFTLNTWNWHQKRSFT